METKLDHAQAAKNFEAFTREHPLPPAATPMDLPEPPRWVIVEVYGHQRFGALMVDVERFGRRFARCEVQGLPGGQRAVLELNPAALFSITECSEDAARSCKPSRDAVPREALRCTFTGCTGAVVEPEEGLCREHDDLAREARWKARANDSSPNRLACDCGPGESCGTCLGF